MTNPSEEEIATEVRRALDQHGRLSVPMAELSDDDELYLVGMTSHATVSVMLALEAVFDVVFPEPMLRQATFASVDSLSAAVGILLQYQKGAGLDQPS